MGLIRFLFFLLILYVLWFMAKNYLRKQEFRASRTNRDRSNLARIVRCKHCEVHLPEPDALRDGEDWFCTPAHKQAWLASSKKSDNDNKRS